MGSWLDPRLLLVATCGSSSGVHAGLVGDHWNQSPEFGVLLVLAAVALALTAAALTVWPEALLPVFLAAGLLGSLIAAWLASGAEVDILGVATKAVEAVGVALAAWVLRRPVTRPADLALAYFGLPFALMLIIASAAGHPA